MDLLCDQRGWEGSVPLPQCPHPPPNPASTTLTGDGARCLPPDQFLPARCDPHGAGAARPHLEVSNRLGLVLDVS